MITLFVLHYFIILADIANMTSCLSLNRAQSLAFDLRASLHGHLPIPACFMPSCMFILLFMQAWPNPTLCAASQETSVLTGPTGVKMSGPYAWTSPYYWYAKCARERRSYYVLAPNHQDAAVGSSLLRVLKR